MTTSEFMVADLTGLHPEAAKERAHVLTYLGLMQSRFAEDLEAMMQGRECDATKGGLSEGDVESAMHVCESLARSIADGTHYKVKPRAVVVRNTGRPQ